MFLCCDQLSCWSELSDIAQDDLIQSLELTFKSPNIPPEIVQTLLNLVCAKVLSAECCTRSCSQ